MGQVTIYLDDEAESQMVEAAQSEHLSKSKWVARLIKSQVANEWPKSAVELAGAWKEFPDVEELRSSLGQDVERESF
ncbi:MAG: CopG family transcriptional regulator [Gammaproteobacteria bacterium]|nr:CopG family transcriptional regulator [Gammaproteobacteria bacterium]